MAELGQPSKEGPVQMTTGGHRLVVAAQYLQRITKIAFVVSKPDVTFTTQADPWKRDRFQDFSLLPTDGDHVVFLGARTTSRSSVH
jgi:hypothetical protein